MTEYLSPQELERYAYHEAAHAVAAYLHGHTILKVWFNSQSHDQPRGRMRNALTQGATEHTGYYLDPLLYRDSAMRILFAPDGVERRLCRERGWLLWGDGTLDDHWQISDWWQYTYGPEWRLRDIGWYSTRRHTMARKWSATFAANDANWRAVGAVATALLSAPVGHDGIRRLEGPATHAIIANTLHSASDSPKRERIA